MLEVVNGLLVAFVGIPPIVATLGTLAIYRGTIYIILGGTWLTQSDMTPAFLGFPKIPLLGLPMLLWIAILVALAMWLFVAYTRTGRMLYAVGGNPVAARYCGVNVARMQCLFIPCRAR